tara:strand:+ start:290 stop:1261 length:972 start_codon:yes stop_codon:yes gene_type:complete
MQKKKIILVGLGYWGKNFKRIAESLADKFEIVALIDNINSSNESTPFFSSVEDFFNSGLEAEAAIISTPSESHYELTKKLIKKDIHCLVEKPFTLSENQAIELYSMAEKKDLIILVDHTFLYDSSIQYMIDTIKKGNIGEVLHMSFQRSNLGPIRNDVNSCWDLSTHDVSILLSILDDMPTHYSADGISLINENIEDIVNVSLTFNDVFVTIFASWLHPEKTREIKIVGTEKMIVWNGMDTGKEVKIHDKGFEYDQDRTDLYKNLVSVRSGETFIPSIKMSEPLKEVVLDFYYRLTGQPGNLLNSKSLTLKIVKVMEGINKNL